MLIMVDLIYSVKSVTIERDEEGNYRALGDVENLKDSKVDVDLVKAVVLY